MLLLFDIDGTLLNTSGSGMRAMHEAAMDHFGPAFRIEGISFAGRLDPLIIGDMLVANGHEDTPEHHAIIRRGYAKKLEQSLAVPGSARALGGVHQLLDALDPHARAGTVTMGLLTGNFEETGSMKLRACGIDPARFAVAAWGDEAPGRPPAREQLVPVGVERAKRFRNRSFNREEVVVIGDTPHDVRCAKVHGGRCLAVATGRSTVSELRDAGADWAVENLSDTPGIARWLLSS